MSRRCDAERHTFKVVVIAPFRRYISRPSIRTASHRIAGRWIVQLHELELTVGDVLQVGHHTVTVLDIDDGEVTFRIEDSEEGEPGDGAAGKRPR